MHWRLNANTARKAFTRDRNKRTMETMRNDGYDTAARILEAQEALVAGVGLLALHDTNRDSKVVREADWKGLERE